MSNTHLTDTAFKQFDLPSTLLQGIEEIGFTFCTPIQALSLPKTLSGIDIMGQAQTGTGKTAAFLISVIHQLLTKPKLYDKPGVHPRALILAPTRELAIQIHKEAEALGKYTGLRFVLVYGGANYDKQRNAIAEGVDILIGTPGRLIDYFKQQLFSLRGIQSVVLDEADRMLDLGFIKDIRFLFRRMPHPDKRLSMLYSATLPLRVTELAYEHMNNPQQVAVDTGKVTAHRITEQVYYVSNPEKIPVLIGLLSNLEITRCIIFVNTKHVAEKVCGYLRGNGFNADVLSGDVQQKKRQSILNRFTQGELPIIVATDVAARGIHVDEVSHVINYDLPEDAEDYVHRIGRTARAGASGSAISLACETYSFSLPEIESYIGYKLNGSTPPPELLAAEIKPPEKRPTDGTRPARRNNPRSGNKGRGRHSGHGDRNKQRNPG